MSSDDEQDARVAEAIRSAVNATHLDLAKRIRSHVSRLREMPTAEALHLVADAIERAALSQGEDTDAEHDR